MAKRSRRRRFQGGRRGTRHAARALGTLLACAGIAGAAEEPSPEPKPTPPDTAEIRALPGYHAERVTSLSFPGEAYVIEAGPETGPPVLLIHGIARDGAHDWDEVIPVLAKHRRVLAMDLPGFGRSSKDPAQYRPMSYASFIDELIDPRIEGDFDIVSHSMGVSIALEVAARHPDRVKHLVVADAAAILHGHALSVGQIERGQEKLGAFGKLLNPVRNLSYDMMGNVSDGLIHRVALGIKGVAARTAAAALMAHDSGAALDVIRAPTLIIWGKRDEVVSPRGLWMLMYRIPGARYIVIDGSAHTPMRDTPAEFNDAVERWLAGDLTVGEALAPAEVASTRDGVCNRHKGSMEFSGAYRKVTIDHCGDVVLRGLRAQQIEITGSTVVGEDVIVSGGEVGISLVKSRLKLSGATITADVPLRFTGSEVDFAGVTFVGTETAVAADGDAKILCSLCRFEVAEEVERFHGFHEMKRGRSFGPAELQAARP